MKLMWSEPNYRNVLIPQLGGLRISWNFLKVIGQHMQDSGLNVMWIEGDLLGGKYYRTCNGRKGLRKGKGDMCSQNHSSSNVATASATTNELYSRTQRRSEAVSLEYCSLKIQQPRMMSLSQS